MSRRVGAVALVFVVGASGVSAQRAIEGSAHDFSRFGWAGSQTCLPCHTPHDAIEGAPRLWGHQMSVATYELHSGVGTAMDSLDTQSRLCMSCHDGTVALDSFGGMSGTAFIEGKASLGVDLSNDHPVGSEAQYPPDPKPSWWDRAYEPTSDLPPNFLESWRDPGGIDRHVVSCATCHSAHNVGGYPSMLTMSNVGSALCMTCHIK